MFWNRQLAFNNKRKCTLIKEPYIYIEIKDLNAISDAFPVSNNLMKQLSA